MSEDIYTEYESSESKRSDPESHLRSRVTSGILDDLSIRDYSAMSWAISEIDRLRKKTRMLDERIALLCS